MDKKVYSLEELSSLLDEERKKGLTIVQCHGVFDLLHPGHIRHFSSAKKKGDKLVVTVTPNRFVNKGPGRPVFSEELRIESIAALECVDYVALSESPDAVDAIEKIKPTFYAKGKEYEDAEKDVTGKINDEVAAVERNQGSVLFTDDIVFSSSSLLNTHYDPISKEGRSFLGSLKKEETNDSIRSKVDSFSDLKVLIIGDAIIDEYQYVVPMGQSGKGLHMVARLQKSEVYLGGAFAIARHIAEFSNNVTLVTAVGKKCPHMKQIKETLPSGINCRLLRSEKEATLTKKRYVLQDGSSLSKLFETYSEDPLLTDSEVKKTVEFLKAEAENFDLILVCDFGNGFMDQKLIELLPELPSFIAINTQINSGNRGFNVITHYKRADFISLNEPEARLAAQDRQSPIDVVAQMLSYLMNAKYLSVTQGVSGVSCYANSKFHCKVPAFNMSAVDRVGAGDSYLALASLALAKGYSLKLASFLGSLAAAIDVQIVGNKEAVKKTALLKYVTRLMK